MTAYRWLRNSGLCQLPLLGLTVSALSLCACGNIESDEATAAQCPATGCFGDASVDATAPQPDATTPPSETSVYTNPFCGTGCNPDDYLAVACEDHDAEVDSGADAPNADAPLSDSSLSKDSESDAAKADAQSKGDSDSGGGNMGGSFGPSTPSGSDAGEKAPAFACQVTWTGQTPKAVCVAGGQGREKDPCSRSSDCAAGLTCVGTLAIAQCLHYCCEGDTNCEKNYYCSEEISRDYLADHPSADPSELRRVPVCIPGRECDPVDPDKGVKCETGLTCTVVRSDGTTGCVALPSDAAKEGGSCKDKQCGQGLVCAKTTNTCLKLCHLGATVQECNGGLCQGGSTGLPSNIGICVTEQDK